MATLPGELPNTYRLEELLRNMTNMLHVVKPQVHDYLQPQIDDLIAQSQNTIAATPISTDAEASRWR
jgi:hypothetical protein